MSLLMSSRHVRPVTCRSASEVDQADDLPSVVVRRQQNVVWLDVAVDNPHLAQLRSQSEQSGTAENRD